LSGARGSDVGPTLASDLYLALGLPLAIALVVVFAG